MTTSPAIVGRDAELAVVDDVLLGDHGSRIVFSGEPGVGKTALLDAAAQRATTHDLGTIRCTGVEFDADVSFSALSEAFRSAGEALDALQPVHREALRVVLGLGQGAVPNLLLVGSATLEALEAMSSRRQTVLIVDDLHWLDRASAVALAFAARRSSRRIRFIGAARTESTFAAHAGIAQHDVLPLTERSAGELIGTRYPLLTSRTRQRILAEAQGNPLALLELATAATDEAKSSTPDAPTEVLPLNERLTALYASRIQALPASTRELLLVAALNSGGELAVLGPSAPRGVLSTLAPAERDGLVSVHRSGRTIVFRHPLVRSTVVELARDIERRRAHYALATALEEQPDRFAWHLAEATVGPDERVGLLLEEAAHTSLGRGDVTRGVELLVRASEASPSSSDRARRAIEAASVHGAVTGDVRAASEMLSSALRDEPTLTDSLPATLAATHILVNAGADVITIHRLLTTALEKCPYASDSGDSTVIDALHELLAVCWMTGVAESWESFDAAVARLRPSAPRLLTLSRSTFGDPARVDQSTLNELTTILTDRRLETDPVVVIRTQFACAYVDRLGDCREALRRIIRDEQDGSAVALALNAMVASATDDWCTGRWEEATKLLADGVALCRQHGYRRHAMGLGDYVSALIAAARGDTVSSEAAATELAEAAGVTNSGAARTLARHVRVVAAMTVGDFDRAYREANAVSPAGHLVPFTPHALWVAFDLVEAAVKTNRVDEARAHVAAMREAGIHDISPRLALVYTACAAMTCEADEATARFDTALAIAGATRWQFDYARVLLVYGEYLRSTGQMTDSRGHLMSALHAFEGLRAAPWVERTQRALRGSGISSRTYGSNRVAAMSELDWEIATLAASGLTNKQIGGRLNMSHRTVGGHLYRIFPVLGITSRAALHEALQVHGRRR